MNFSVDTENLCCPELYTVIQPSYQDLHWKKSMYSTLCKNCGNIVEACDFLLPKAWFPLDRNGIMKLCDSNWFWVIIKRLIKIENKNLTEIASDL